MYLNKRTYIGNQYREEEKRVTVNVPEIKSERISEIIEQVGYWRKANAIHGWFIRNCADGDGERTKMEVEREQLQELLDTCKKVLKGSKIVKGKIANGYHMEKVAGKLVQIPILEDGKYIEDDKLAKELLPTEDGFFFGGTDYDDWYIENLKNTVKILEEVLAEPDNGQYFEYEASW